MKKGIVFDIKKYSLHDGPGIRTTVFLKGCPLRCWWCHNPESQNLKPDILPKSGRRKDFYTPVSDTQEAIGKKVSVDEIIQEIEKDIIFYDESGGGVTFSGGEPLMQIDFLDALLNACKEREIHTAVDTTGYTSQKNLNRILPKTDLFLYDIKIMDEDAHQKYASTPLALILSNLQFLAEKNARVHYRIPVIPNITDKNKNLQKIMDFLISLQNGNQVSLLPYNHFGDEKYKRLRMKNRMPKVSSPSREAMEKLKLKFEDRGFSVKIGG